MDRVRVLRIIEYDGPRDRVEETIARSVTNWRDGGRGLKIRAVTLGTFPEVLGDVQRRDDSFDSVFNPNEAVGASDWGKRGA